MGRVEGRGGKGEGGRRGRLWTRRKDGRVVLKLLGSGSDGMKVYASGSRQSTTSCHSYVMSVGQLNVVEHVRSALSTDNNLPGTIPVDTVATNETTPCTAGELGTSSS